MNTATFKLPKNLLCFSHLRWDFVFQRPQHLLTRFAEEQNVYFLEEPHFDSSGEDHFTIEKRGANLTLLIPHLSTDKPAQQVSAAMKKLVSAYLHDADLSDWVFWYYTPMALSYAEHLKPAIVVFDCMDELSAFDFAPKELVEMEKRLMKLADVVFTGGHSLYEAKKAFHHNIFPFPSSIDRAHFGTARSTRQEPADQAGIKGIKLGFFGVIDERFDIELIADVARQRPEWQLMLLGPVVKISAEILPQGENIHYLGQKSYQQLPEYISGWDIALIPFKLNESTRYISPTKTPEYLAGGVRVVSTPIRDVIKPYGIEKLVSIAGQADEFIMAVEQQLKEQREHQKAWLTKVDAFLKDKSWDHTFTAMKQQMISTLNQSGALLAS